MISEFSLRPVRVSPGESHCRLDQDHRDELRNAVGPSGKEPYYFSLTSNLLPYIQNLVSLSACVMENSYVDAC